ncbi:MAG TPA: hypothetical protein VF240_02585 [Pyrinomonadaceae bacterium]
MPRATTRKRNATASKTSDIESLDLMRTGMPARDSIVKVWRHSKPSGAKKTSGAKSMKAAASGVAAFRIIRTNEVDGYEKGATAEGTLAKMSAATPSAAAANDNFTGTQRRAAKISIAKAPLRTYTDLKNLVRYLPTDESMIKRTPKIGKTATSDRVEEEMRNVRVKVFLYAASRENDNDYHLILGRDPSKTPELYITMELSGLPPADSTAFAKLKAARDAFKAHFASDLPGKTYDFYDPPRPVEIEGSMFFDIGHATGTRPGPRSLKSRMPTVWEVHPITKIVFNP